MTGGAGFIGSHLCDALVALGAEVSVIDDLSTGSEENLEAIRQRIRFVQGSILDPAALFQATSGALLIFHQAAATSVPASVEQPQRYHEINATGTLRVLEAARVGTSDETRVISASSSSVYGDREESPLLETMMPRPLSPYAASKCAGELLLRTYAACYGLSGVSLRYFNVFGARQRPDSPYAAVIPRFAQALIQKNQPVIYGDGLQTRDFTHVSNAVRANLLAGACTAELTGQVVNAACGRSTNLLELLGMMREILGVEAEPQHLPPRIGDVLHSRADISLARELLGYEPATSLGDGLKDAVAWYEALFAANAPPSG
ncbi:MAG: NAD-dependent epimerase/dehydratase family protein [Planctomycetota bacterium]